MNTVVILDLAVIYIFFVTSANEYVKICSRCWEINYNRAFVCVIYLRMAYSTMDGWGVVNFARNCIYRNEFGSVFSALVIFWKNYENLRSIIFFYYEYWLISDDLFILAVMKILIGILKNIVDIEENTNFWFHMSVEN